MYNANDICMTCHEADKYDVKDFMWKNSSDPYGHITIDHSWGAVKESDTKVNPTTKKIEITNPAVLETIKKKFPDLAK